MLTSDYDDVMRFFAYLWGEGEFREVRVKAKRVWGKLFNNKEDAATYAAEKSNDPTTVAVWVTTNPVDPNEWKEDQKLTTDASIDRIRAFFVDCDSIKPKGCNATEEELEATRVVAYEVAGYLESVFLARPIVVMTGNGYALWYRVNLEAADTIIQRVLETLHVRFPCVDTTVHNAGRVGKLPGTMARKGPHTPDRPHRLAKIVETPDSWQPIPRELLERVAGPVKEKQAEFKLFDVEGFLASHKRPILGKKRKGSGTIYELACVIRPDEKDGGCWIWQSDDGKIRAGCHHEKCKGKTWKHIRLAIDPNFDKEAEDKLPQGIKDPEQLGRKHLEKHLHLVLYRESVWIYDGGVYREQTQEAVKRAIRLTIMGEFGKYADAVTSRGLDLPLPVISEGLVNSVYGVITSLIPEVSSNLTIPVWRDGRTAKNVLIAENGILNLDTRQLQPHTPELFAAAKLPYNYDPSATCPAWDGYLTSVWPDDPDSIQLAQEISGYTLQTDNPLQALFLFQGATRGGKTLYVRTNCRLVGVENTCSISIRNLLKDFSLWGARHKSIIVIPDISAPKHGLPTEIVELLKAVSGNDPIDVNGKGRDIVSEPLTGKIFAASNDMLEFSDSSGAFFERLVGLKYTRSFLDPDHPDYVDGQIRDPDLEGKLLDELPGILNWALVGLDRIRKTKRFTQPAASLDLKAKLSEDGTPIKKFIADCLVCVSDGRATVNDVFNEWAAWCGNHDYDTATVGSKRTLGKLLFAALPKLKCEKSESLDANNKRPREYRGIEIRSNTFVER